MGLNDRGYIAIVQVVVYTPILLATAFLVHRHWKVQQGWLFLAMFSICTSLVCAVLKVADSALLQFASSAQFA